MSSYIKRMRLKGFKSFANPTILKFEDGFNSVVGANGSGKSNVFDALCFVLGRISSKGLRADKLGNLVFNGGKNLKPASTAEVELYLTNYNKELMNADLDEVKISRVVKRDGQSTYLLNNNKVTRTEIVEILRRASIDPDGYNIILQGDIMRIVNMTPVERRELIEEISDISGYEEKRTRSLGKLEKVELDLKEADLLMDEKTRYLKELKTEKEQAQMYHKTKDELRTSNLLLVKAKLMKNSQLRNKKNEEFEECEKIIEKYKEKLDIFEKKVKEIEVEISKTEKEIEIKSHNDFIEVTNKITALEAEIQNFNEKKSEYSKQIEEIKTRNEGIKENIKTNKLKKSNDELTIKEYQIKKEKLQLELGEIEKRLGVLKKGISSTTFKELENIDNQIEELQSRKYQKEMLKHENSLLVERYNSKLEHINQDLDKLNNAEDENQIQMKELEKFRNRQKELIVSISEKANKNSETSAKLNSLQKEYSEVVETHSRLKMKSEASRDLMATNKAVDTLLKLKRNDSKIHGSVSELATVPNKYSMALETVAGKALFNIVVESDSTAVKYINYLKENRIGNATFLPLNKIRAKYSLDDSVLNKKGVIDYALNLIRYDPVYENVFHLIFSDTIVIEKIEDAKGVGIGDYKMVTLEGDIVAKSGAMSGGFKTRSKSFGAFKDEAELDKLERVETKLASLQSAVDILRSEKESLEGEVYDLRQEKIEVEGEIAKLEKILSIDSGDTRSLTELIKSITEDKVLIENSVRKSEREIAEIEKDLSVLTQKKSKLKEESSSHSKNLEKITEVEQSRDELKENLMEINKKIDSLSIHINNVIIPENASLDKILRDSDESLTKISKSIFDIKESLKHKIENLDEFKKKEKELSKDYKQYIDKRDSLKKEREVIEKEYEKEYKSYDSQKQKSAELKYAVGEYNALIKALEEELELLYEELKAEFITIHNEDNFNEDDIEAEVEQIEDEKKTSYSIAEMKIDEIIRHVDDTLRNDAVDVKNLQIKVNNLKSKLTSFGSINMKAVRIYDKLSEEFNELIEKRQTLNDEKKDILDFIYEMDEKKKEKFLETFEKLQSHFINIFSKLSTKGEVELLIEDEKDLFNSGVEIRVRLSKKNYLDIKSLSGGEKTITAIAFIFAVQEFNPASFYIFDEVDAALDIMNSEKLGVLIKEYSSRAQYIVVSHSEYLIQSAEAIYGVTMDENKISSVLSLDLKSYADYVEKSDADNTKV